MRPSQSYIIDIAPIIMSTLVLYHTALRLGNYHLITSTFESANGAKHKGLWIEFRLQVRLGIEKYRVKRGRVPTGMIMNIDPESQSLGGDDEANRQALLGRRTQSNRTKHTILVFGVGRTPSETTGFTKRKIVEILLHKCQTI